MSSIIDAILRPFMTASCQSIFLSFNIKHAEFGMCFKDFISNGVGIGLILGACLVLVPQIIGIVRAGATKGLSPLATYGEFLALVAQSVIFLRPSNEMPFNKYGETLIMTGQTALLIALMWYYSKPGLLDVALLPVAVAAVASFCYYYRLDADLAATALSAGEARKSAMEEATKWHAYVTGVTSAVFAGGRILQIYENLATGSTGVQAIITLLMKFAGTAARIGTGFDQASKLGWPTAQVALVLSSVVTSLLNLTLVVQYFVYQKKGAGEQQGSGGKKTAAAAAAASSKRAASADNAKGKEKKEDKEDVPAAAGKESVAAEKSAKKTASSTRSRK